MTTNSGGAMERSDQREARAAAEQELAVGAVSAREGNEGRARVCARRAAGAAIRYWMEQNPGVFRGRDAVSQLKEIAETERFPAGIRDAARRLTARITTEFTAPHIEDPLEDGRMIVDYLLPRTPGG